MTLSKSVRVLLGLLIGAGAGLMLADTDPQLAASIANAVAPIGKLWLNALQMTIVPLVMSLLVIGVATASDGLASGRIARDAMTVFVAVLVGASIFAALLGPLLLSLLPRDPQLVETLRQAMDSPVVAAGVGVNLGDWFATIVPTNAIAAAAQGAIVPLVVFTLFLAFALLQIAPARRNLALEGFHTLADAMGVIVGWVLWAAPVGVFALILPVSARAGVDILSALGWYILLLCAMYLAMTGLMLLLAVIAGGEPLRRFAGAILPAQVVAASTQSSLASLPAMVDSSNRLGYPTAVSSLVLPMAVSLFRITSPVQYMGVAAFIAWTYGIDLPIEHLAIGAALAVVISIGSVGLPGQASFMGTNLPVVQAMGLPIEPLGLLLAVDMIPDVFATVGNVSADLAATSVVAKRQPAGGGAELEEVIPEPMA